MPSENLRALLHVTASQGRNELITPPPRARATVPARRIRPHLRLRQAHLEVPGRHPRRITAHTFAHLEIPTWRPAASH